MKSLRFLFLLLLTSLLLLHLAPAQVAAQEQHLEGITLRNLWIFPVPGGGLWRTDGTAEGTFQLPLTSDFVEIVGRSGGRVFLLVDVPELALPHEVRYQLWATDGNRNGTRQLTTIPGGLPYVTSWSNHAYLSAPQLGLFFFRASTPATGAELWVSDGTPAGTRLVTELAHGSGDGVGQLLAALEGRILFEGITPQGGAELWVSDGTGAQTRLLREFWPGPASSQPRLLTILDARAFLTFAAPDLQHEMWVTDGTAMGTRPLYVLNPSPPDATRRSRWMSGDAGETQVFLLARDLDEGQYLVRSDGTSGGTYPLLGSRDSFTALGDRVLFFRWDAEYGEEPWVSDGTREGTHLLRDIYRGSDSPMFATGFFRVGSLAYLLVDEHFNFGGYVTDGTTEGTRFFFVFPCAISEFPTLIAGPQGRLFFDICAGMERELWVTPAVGGEPGSATRLLDVIPQKEGHLLTGAPLGDLFLFIVRDLERGMVLWRSDATAAGTFPVIELAPPQLPGPISRLTAKPDGLGTGQLILSWSRAERVESYELKQRALGGGFPEWWLSPELTTFTASPLIPGLPYAFRIRAVNSYGAGPWSEITAATPLPDVIMPCTPTNENLCLQGSRFEVKTYYLDHIHGSSGVGRAAPFDFSDDSGAFWFFTPNNLELVVKVLDARVVNGYFWSFFGGLTSLETWITVTDTEAQTNVTFYKGRNDLCGRADVSAFPRPAFEALGVAGTCEPGPDRLCLTDDRYRVEVAWRDQRSGDTGVGHALPGTEDSGFFWFFDDENVELLVKVLDAQIVNGHTWVFFGALTDVEYTLTVTDTLTGERKHYFNPPGSLCGQADVAAF